MLPGQVLRPQKGVSLVEVIVATTILFIVGLGFMTTFTGLYSALSDSGNYYLATQIARDNLEGWSKAWSSGQSLPTGGTTSIAGDSNGNKTETTFTWSFTHTAAVAGGVEQADCLVSWTQKGAGDRTGSVKLSTWVAKE